MRKAACVSVLLAYLCLVAFKTRGIDVGTATHSTYFALRQDKETKEVEVMLQTSDIVHASMCGFTRNNNTQEKTGLVEARTSEEAKKIFLERLRNGTGLVFG